MPNGDEEAPAQTRRDYSAEFEEEVREFLRQMGLNDVNGGPAFHIAPPGQKNQIDACARYKKVLIVFECKASGRAVKKNLRDDILEFKTKINMAFEGRTTLPQYKDCNYIVGVFATKKNIIPDGNVFLIEKTAPKGIYVDEHFFEYYTDLFEKIDKFAKYNLLYDLGILAPSEDQFRAMAIKTKISGIDNYLFYANPCELLKFAYVARRGVGKESFYQRSIEKSRLNKIAKFIDGGGFFPTNIVISLKHEPGFFSSKKIRKEIFNFPKGMEIGAMEIQKFYSSCWIVDGQHRLYAFAKSKTHRLVPCIAFTNINEAKERSFFLEINKEQKPIQPDLIWDLEGQADPDCGSERGLISNIVRELDTMEPFTSKIFIPVKGTKSGTSITMSAFCNGIVNSKITKRFILKTPNEPGRENILFVEKFPTKRNRVVGVLNRYFSKINEKISPQHRSFVMGNAGIPILLYLLEPILAKFTHIPNQKDFDNYADAIKKYFESNYPDDDRIKKLKLETTSESARKSLAREIGHTIRSELKDPSFWPTMEESEVEEEITCIERKIGKLIAKRLSALEINWKKQRTGGEIFNKVQRRVEQEGGEFEDFLGLGEEKEIIVRKDNWDESFKNDFVGRDKFNNKEEFETAFLYLMQVRNPRKHGRDVEYNQETMQLCRAYLRRFERLLEKLVPENEVEE